MESSLARLFGEPISRAADRISIFSLRDAASNTSIVNNTTNYSDVISKLNDIITELKQQISISIENRDINNASLIQLEDIAKVI